ncbi:MAG TPA: hypothetical protein PKY96_17075 [Flavobacteriales bacterium]|nr:hypothetical protein [Flavobacteriales bacterium]
MSYDDHTWEFISKSPGSVTSQGLAMLSLSEADYVYIFENRDTGARVRVYASSMERAGEKLSDGDFYLDND